jgi:glycosyltransferase involved in cell wall biosynthesis
MLTNWCSRCDARFVVVENEFTLCQVRRRSPPECWGKLRLIPKSVDPFYSDTPTGVVAAGFPEFPRLVCVGRLVQRKGQSLLLRAARVLKDELFVEVVFIGDGPERASLERQIADLGLEDRVRLLGWLDRSGIKREVLAARSLVLPSLSEGLPTVLLEALALGRPVIATDVAAVSELVSHRENGWLIRPGSISELVDAIREAMTMSGAQLAAMGAAGRRTVSERATAWGRSRFSSWTSSPVLSGSRNRSGAARGISSGITGDRRRTTTAAAAVPGASDELRDRTGDGDLPRRSPAVPP